MAQSSSVITEGKLRGMSMRAIWTIGALCVSLARADAQEPINPNQVGRYQIMTNANNTFLVDTAGGFVWVLTQFTEFNKDPLAWVPMFRLNRASDTTPLLSEFGLKPPTKR